MVKYLTIIFCLLLSIVEITTAAEVEVTISPETFRAGERAQLSITVSDGRLETIPQPVAPEGVLLQSRGLQQSVQIINGSVSRSITQNYIVTASQAGDYTIAPFDINADGQTIKTKPIKFKVIGSTATVPNQAPTSPSQSSDIPEDNTSFLKLDFLNRESKSLYVGEMAPVRVRAFFPRSTQLSQLTSIRTESSGYTLHHLSERPEESLEAIDGKTYIVYTWYAGLSFAKAGDLPVNLALDATVLVPDTSRPKRQRPSGRGSLFDHFFSDDFFGRQRIPKEYKLEAKHNDLTIKPLPTVGRPENFNGAVGTFKIEGYSLPIDGNTGEPQNLHVTISGKGNFDRLSAPKLQPTDSWKTYTPKTEFEPDDVISFSGKKTFRFNAIPQKSGPMKLSLGFSYFDPYTKQYHQAQSAEVDATITGESIVAKPTATKAEPTQETVVGLLPNRKIRKGGTTLIPTVRRPSFWILLSLITLTAIGFTVWQTLERRHHSPTAIATRKARSDSDATQAEVHAAAKTNDPKEFFDRAQNAIKQRAAALWGINPSAITLADLKRRLPADSPVLKVFAKGDAFAYGGSLDSNESLPNWQSLFQDAMQSLAEKQ